MSPKDLTDAQPSNNKMPNSKTTESNIRERPSTSSVSSATSANRIQEEASTSNASNGPPSVSDPRLPIFPFGMYQLFSRNPLMNPFLSSFPLRALSTMAPRDNLVNPALSVNSFLPSGDLTMPWSSRSCPGFFNNVGSGWGAFLNPHLPYTGESSFLPIPQTSTASPNLSGAVETSVNQNASSSSATYGTKSSASSADRVQHTSEPVSQAFIHTAPSNVPFKKRRFFSVQAEVKPNIIKKTVLPQRRPLGMQLPSLHPGTQNVMASISGPLQPTVVSCNAIAGTSRASSEAPCSAQVQDMTKLIPNPCNSKNENSSTSSSTQCTRTSSGSSVGLPPFMVRMDSQCMCRGTIRSTGNPPRYYPSGKKIGRPPGTYKRVDLGSSLGSSSSKIKGTTFNDVLRKEVEETNVSNEVVDVETLTEEKCEWGSCQLIFSTQKV
ncbi:hypothetical protein NECAME_08667 [Necator americanus]|uniref:Uncharacterized protein n=1 Tax=Necator americanus TaxID=51031 RepID=W2TJN5_NECAM|nr:hypothetical protein NECAME_08667 [Necator americanus]ETN81227.1 hypothetical protein NECAME_08667 [Necator americanus]